MNSTETKPSFIVGLDIAKFKFDSCLLDPISENKLASEQFSNQPKDFPAFETGLRKRGVLPESTVLCMESTGIYGLELLEWLLERGWRVALVNPARIKAYAQCMGLRNKTDQGDAFCIAHFCHTQKPRLWSGCSPKISLLRRYLVRLSQIQLLMDRETNALEATRQKEIIESCARLQEALQEEYKLVQKAVTELIEGDADLKTQSENLRTIPGVGAGTAPQMIQLVQSRPFAGARQAAAHVGLNVRHHQSGKMEAPPRLSKMGDWLVRKQLWWPAIHAMRSEDFAPWVAQLRSRGLANKQIICAVMRKLVHIAFGVISSGQPYDRKLAFPTFFS